MVDMVEFRIVQIIEGQRKFIPGVYETRDAAQAALDRAIRDDSEIAAIALREPEVPADDDGSEFRMRYLWEGHGVPALRDASYAIVAREVTSYQ